jgi:hypothetical protein
MPSAGEERQIAVAKHDRLAIIEWLHKDWAMAFN